MTLRSLRVGLQLAITIGLLALLWHLSGGQALLDRLVEADPIWMAAGLVCATAAMLAVGARWHYTARQVGLDVTLERSVREVYLSVFLNVVLPGGLAGDALRAWRHGRGAAGDERKQLGPAVRAVVIERMANQLVLSLCVLASLALWPWMKGAFTQARIWVPLVGTIAVLGGGLAVIAILARRTGDGQLGRFLRDSRRALLGRRALPAQLFLGLLVIGSCLALFHCAARAVHAPLPFFYLVALVPGALLAMSIPISIGGWGLREASAVALWTMAGLSASDAMATSVLYGLLVLIGALPGAAVLILDR